MGRTGKMFAAEHTGVVPDVVLRGQGDRVRHAAGRDDRASKQVMTWPAGSHGSTIAGNPVAIAAGLATIDLLEKRRWSPTRRAWAIC